MIPRLTVSLVVAVGATTILTFPLIGLSVPVWCGLAYLMVTKAAPIAQRMQRWIESHDEPV